VLLSELVTNISPPLNEFRDVEIKGLTADSRNVQPGFLFAALDGSCFRGRNFIPDALRQGAVAILLSDQIEDINLSDSITLITDQNPRKSLAIMAARFYQNQPQFIAAVTGTNGKSSVADFTRQIWINSNYKAASIGTLGLIQTDQIRDLQHTTPDPIELHKTLAELSKQDTNRVIIEASSHGLDQYRLDGADIIAAAHLNITHDHLDYHLDISKYLDAKAGLFSRVLSKNGTAVLNADDSAYDYFQKICSKRALRIITYGSDEADLSLKSSKALGFSQELKLRCFGSEYEVCINLPGKFQIYNALASVALAISTGVSLEDAIYCLPKLEGVRGRLELIDHHPNGAPIIIDYAHSPAAINSTLLELRKLTKGRLILVFGCGGDRDKKKRSQMGSIAESIADIVFITDDNPRNENPAKIRKDILSGCPGAFEVGDRKEAIKRAISSLKSNDMLLVAGKGHETTQILDANTLPFDDALVIRSSMGELKK
tara:strand:- start:3770 stop:5230 length:1461 start_codon:yes stop_codon:yes gene_type:complete